MTDGWPLPDDVVCPECGEEEYLMGHVVRERQLPVDPVTDETKTEVLEADLRCGDGVPRDGEVPGCGHTWTWTAEEDD